MHEAQGTRDILAEVMTEGRKVLTPLLAEMLSRRGVQEVDTSEERRRFWQAALTNEQEQEMWLQEMTTRGITHLLPGSPEAIDIGLKISKAKYPDRWDMAGGEGRDHLSQQAMWAAKHARRGPPKQEQQPAAPKAAPAMGEGY